MFAVSDYYAIDLMCLLQREGLRIPDDISLIGFDGSRDCAMVTPALTSVAQDSGLRAQKALELLARMKGSPDFRESVRIPVHLVPGGSVRSVFPQD